MEMVALVTLCIGSALGLLRFRVFVLLPAVLVAVTVVTAWALAQGGTLGSIAVLNVVGVTCLQFGYLGGAVLASLTAAGRLGGAKGSQSARPMAR
jgi:hypothetical protein